MIVVTFSYWVDIFSSVTIILTSLVMISIRPYPEDYKHEISRVGALIKNKLRIYMSPFFII